MALYALADLHLSLSVPEKTMAIFDGWDNYIEKIKKNWNDIVKDGDVVVIPGDISWAMNIKECYKDFEYINNLKGIKILMRGNHDYWWTTSTKIQNYFDQNGFDTLHLVFNNHYNYDDKYAICGTRGWVDMDGKTDDEKIKKREAGRLELSIKSAVDDNKIPLVFLHYPPVYINSVNEYLIEVLHRYNIDHVWYGHIHGSEAHKRAFQGIYEGIRCTLVAGDYLHFFPYRIL